MKKIKTNLKRIITVAFSVIAAFCLTGSYGYAQNAIVPAFVSVLSEPLDFTITDEVQILGSQGQTELSITPIVVTNNSSEQYINVSNISYQSSYPNLTLVADSNDFKSIGDSYSLVVNKTHDFSSGSYTKYRPVMINGGTQTFKLTGQIGMNCTPYLNQECGNFIVTVEKTDEPVYNSIPISNLSTVTWADGSVLEIKSVLEAAYDGIIDPETYCGWKVGDSRSMYLGSVVTQYNPEVHNNSPVTIPQQNLHLVLLNKGGETLITGEECQYVVGFKEIVCMELWDKPDKKYGYVIGDAYNEYVDSCADQMANKIYTAMPTELKTIFKDWKVYVAKATPIISLSDDSRSWNTDASEIELITRKFALPALNNLYSMSEQLERNAFLRTCEDDCNMIQYEYFKSADNRLKSLVGATSYESWWCRTPTSCYRNGDFFSARSVNKRDQIPEACDINDGKGISPVGCI